jgi:nucleotide-binding universal stress UspA family protein
VYSKILVPLDGSKFSEQILPYAGFFADAFKIPVALLHVTHPDARPPFWPSLSEDRYLSEIAVKCFPLAARVTTAEKIGMPEDVIVDNAKGDPSCLIAMATHGMSGMRRWLIGSVASKVVQTAANPLLLVRPRDIVNASMPVKLDTAIVPLDGSGLAEKTLPHVRALARAANIQAHLLRVYAVPTNPPVIGDGVFVHPSAAYREQLEKEARTYVDGKAAGLRAEGFERVVATVTGGDAAGEIIDLARQTPNNLIVMSTHGRSGLSRWVLGSVAEKVVQHSEDPVLLVRAP